MNVLVIGGAGFIGSHVVDILKESGINVTVLDNLSTGKKENIPEVPLLIKDVRDDLSWVFLNGKFDTIIFLAAQVSVQKSIQNPLYDLQINVQGFINVLENAIKYNVRKVVFASSAAVYGNPISIPITEDHELSPLSPYGLNKLMAEKYLQMYSQLYNLSYVILRYSNVYGPRQTSKGESGVISIFSEKFCNGIIPEIFGDGSDTRDYVYVEDVAKANLLSISTVNNGIYNVGTQKATTLSELYYLFREVTGKNSEAKYSNNRKGDIKHSLLNSQLIKENLGWEPEISLREGLFKTVAWNLKLIQSNNDKESQLLEN